MEQVQLCNSAGHSVNVSENKQKGRYYITLVKSVEQLQNIRNMKIYHDDVMLLGYMKSGHSVNVLEDKKKGRYYITLIKSVEQLQNIRNLKMYEDDVILLGYMKSGTHWMSQVLEMILTGKAQTSPLNTFKGFIELGGSDDVLSSLGNPRVLNTHLWPDEIPQAAIQMRCRHVYVLRNPKDVLVSFYHFCKGTPHFGYNGDFSGMLELFVKGKVPFNSWFEQILTWERFYTDHPDIPAFFAYYEDFKQDMHVNLDKLAAFLGVPWSSVLRDAIAEKSTFDAMKSERRQDYELEEMKGRYQDGVHTVYRKGEVGDWKNYFTVAQSEQFDKIYAEKMAGSQINLRFQI